MIATTLTLCGVRAALDSSTPTIPAYPLSPCCGASAKGGDEDHPIVCRACYQPISAAIAGSLLDAIRAAGCPAPDECEAHTRWTLEQEIERTEVAA